METRVQIRVSRIQRPHILIASWILNRGIWLNNPHQSNIITACLRNFKIWWKSTQLPYITVCLHFIIFRVRIDWSNQLCFFLEVYRSILHSLLLTARIRLESFKLHFFFTIFLFMYFSLSSYYLFIFNSETLFWDTFGEVFWSASW